MRTLVTGATGFIGHRLLSRLDRPVILSRNANRAARALASYEVDAYDWDPLREPAPAAAFDGVNTVVHLAGESIAGRWTGRKKKRMHDSRVLGTRHLVETLCNLDHRPTTLVSASAVGYYGSRGDQELDEEQPPGEDFLAELCVAWENEARRAAEAGIRVVTPRFGIVLGNGGALAKMLLPFKMGMGGRLGSGRQWMPWVHLDDVVALLLYAARHTELEGPYNAVAPQPVTNAEFTKTLGRVLGRPTVLPVPAPLLRVALGEFADTLLGSQKVVPRRTTKAGFDFGYTHLESALREIVAEAKAA